MLDTSFFDDFLDIMEQYIVIIEIGLKYFIFGFYK